MADIRRNAIRKEKTRSVKRGIAKKKIFNLQLRQAKQMVKEKNAGRRKERNAKGSTEYRCKVSSSKVKQKRGKEIIKDKKKKSGKINRNSKQSKTERMGKRKKRKW